MKRLTRQLGCLLALSLLGGGAVKWLHPRAPVLYAVNEVLGDGETTYAEVMEKWGGDVLWIDARPRRFYDEGHLKGALYLSPQDADELMFEYFEQLQDEERPVVVYCASRACEASRKIATYLSERTTLSPILTLHGGWRGLPDEVTSRSTMEGQ